MILPFGNIAPKFSTFIPAVENMKVVMNQTESFSKNLISSEKQPTTNTVTSVPEKSFDYFILLKWLYFLVMTSVLVRFFIGLIVVYHIYMSSSKEREGSSIVLKNEEIKYPFSFLNLIFINAKELNDNELKSVIAHENIHVSQHHTLDLILIELIAAVMWFNPFVWLMRKSLRQVHEYLADEGVLCIGFDRIEYQALLVNQVAESRLIGLASGFNKSIIKKRILMMTNRKSYYRTKLKLIALIPATTILIFAIACMNGQNKNIPKNAIVAMPPTPPMPPSPPNNSVKTADAVAAIAPTRMNVFYVGVDNPVDISVSGYKSEDLEVKIDNGVIKGSNGAYTVYPKGPGKATITVFANGTKVKESVFRVKIVPDPVAMVYGMKGGSIKKSVLLSQMGIVAEMENFDFDLSFKIAEFRVSTVNEHGKAVEATSHDNNFTPEQKAILESCTLNQKVYIEEIKALGPDGATRDLGTIALTVD